MKIKTQTESYLRNTQLPTATQSYTPIAHGDIIDEVRKALTDANFTIESELYKAEHNGEVAAGYMEISTDLEDPDMSMTFNWTNSYNKVLRFSCGIGGFILENKVPFVSKDAEVTWARKHTGTAKTESTQMINAMVSHAQQHFAKIIAMKDKFKAIPVDRAEYSTLMGLLFFDKDFLGIEQSTQIRNEYNTPSFDYSNKGTLWEVYKMIMFGVKEQSPKTWYKQQIELNTFITLRYYHGVPESLPAGFDNTTVDDERDLTSLQNVDVNVDYEKQMAGRDEDNYYVGTDNEQQAAWDHQTRIAEGLDHKGGDDYYVGADLIPADDSPQIDGIPNGDTISDTDDTEPELVDVAFEDDGRAVPVYDDEAGNVDYPEVNIEDEAPVYDKDRIAESIREDEAAVAEVCDERIIVTEDTPPLTADQLSSAVFEENESEDDFDMVVDVPSIEMTDEQIELHEEENQVKDQEPVEEESNNLDLPFGNDDFNSCPPAEVIEEETVVPKVEVSEEVQEVLDNVYPNATVTEVTELGDSTLVDLSTDEFFIVE